VGGPAGVSTETDEAYQMVKAGVLNGVSQGFLIAESDTKPMLPKQTGLTTQQAELLEVSLVVPPSCASCLVTERSHRRNPARR